MDQDLIDYLDRRFSSLEQRVGQQIQTLREETSQRFDGVDQRLDKVDQRLGGVDQRLDKVDQRLGGVDQRLGGVDQRLESLETDVRRAYVAVEDLRDDLRLVAEGVTNVNERLDRNEENASQRFQDIESLIQQSHQDLDIRVRKLEGFG
jgi:archaellum component FlaC